MDPKSNASISSYATFGDNPVWFIDPNGQDWYQPIDGSASIWKEGCAKTVIIDGEKYVNIGASHTVYNPYSHSYENYFQDHLISMGNKENALTRIVNDEALKIEFLGSKSTSNEDKSTILKASIHQGQNDFIRGTADLTANSLSIGGTGLTAMGTGLLAVPGLQGVGIGLIGLGNTMNTTGTLMNIGLNIIDGEWGKATVNALSLGSSIGIGKGLNNLRLTPNQASFLEGSSGTYISIFSEITNWGLDQNKKK